MPDVTTIRESGFNGVPAYLWIGLLAPLQTPTAIIDKLNAAMKEGLKAPDVRTSTAKLGLETRTLTRREFTARMADEAVLWEAAVKESKVKVD
jgi:tripartite-type tricarboxylate transporter receptor subunit TctC